MYDDYVKTIENFPAVLRKLVEGLTPEQLTTPYLAGEWTVAQNVHHMVDSHINSVVRLKLILTEDNPPLKPYNQDAWAELVDATDTDIEDSLKILEGLHRRWGKVLRSLTHEQRQRTGKHPEVGSITPADLAKMYAEHCDAHIDQIQRTLKAAPGTASAG
jgi:hypothetical protein